MKIISKLRQRNRAKQRKINQLKKKVKSLEDVIAGLRKQNLISEHLEEHLSEKFSGMSLEIFKRMMKCKKTGHGTKYSPELRSFALTLQFYSTKAYNFVRKTFSLSLSHESTISNWYSKVPAEPGFTQPALHAISLKVNSLFDI